MPKSSEVLSADIPCFARRLAYQRQTILEKAARAASFAHFSFFQIYRLRLTNGVRASVRLRAHRRPGRRQIRRCARGGAELR